MADNKKKVSKKNSWSPKTLPSQPDGCVESFTYKPLSTDVNKPGADKENWQQEKDGEDVLTSSEQSEEKQIPRSDSPDNLDQEKATDQLILSPSASIDEGTCEPCTGVNTSEEGTGNGQTENDDDDVFKTSEKTDEEQRPGSSNLVRPTPSINRNRPISFPSQKFHTLKPKRLSGNYETPRPTDSLSQAESIDELKEWWQGTSKKIERKREPCEEVNTAEADKGNGQKETGAKGDQPDIAPQTPQSTPVSEVEDQASADLAHEMIFRDLSDKIGIKWEKLATYLGVIEKNLEYIKMNNPNNVENQIYYMLRKWKSLCENFGSSSFFILADKLECVGLKRLAEELRGQLNLTPP